MNLFLDHNKESIDKNKNQEEQKINKRGRKKKEKNIFSSSLSLIDQKNDKNDEEKNNESNNNNNSIEKTNKRKKNRYYLKNRNTKKNKKDKKEIIKFLEETGKLNDYLSPTDDLLNQRLIYLYNKIIKIDNYLNSKGKNISEKRLNCIKKVRKKYSNKFINLSNPLIGAVISKQKTIPEEYKDMYSLAIIALLEFLKKKDYNPEKGTKITSQIYEKIRQGIINYSINIIKRNTNELTLIIE